MIKYFWTLNKKKYFCWLNVELKNNTEYKVCPKSNVTDLIMKRLYVSVHYSPVIDTRRRRVSYQASCIVVSEILEGKNEGFRKPLFYPIYKSQCSIHWNKDTRSYFVWNSENLWWKRFQWFSRSSEIKIQILIQNILKHNSLKTKVFIVEKRTNASLGIEIRIM